MNDGTIFLSREVVANRLSVSLQSVSRLIKDAKLEAVKIGTRRVGITLASYESYVKTLRGVK
jgi:excisionase family DNA binding protein